MNLLKETLSVLNENNKLPSDVVFCQTDKAQGTWDDFATIADIEYDNGYGWNEIDGSLVIVGDGWWLERGEYDGAEWWDFKTLPMPAKSLPKFSSKSDLLR